MNSGGIRSENYLVRNPGHDDVLLSLGLINVEQNKGPNGTRNQSVNQLLRLDTVTGEVELIAYYGPDQGVVSQLSPNLEARFIRFANWLIHSEQVLLGGPDILNLDDQQITPFQLGSPRLSWPNRPGLVDRRLMIDDVVDRDQLPCNTVSNTEVVVESFDNMIAYLQSEVNGAAVELSGIVSDRNLAHYRLEWRPVADATQWLPVTDLIGTEPLDQMYHIWVPPSPGQYRVRLTVVDLAGNQSFSESSLAWNISSSISDVRVSPRFISPNGDAIQDESMITFAVNQPVELNVLIRNEQGELVRQFSEVFTAIGQTETLSWNGLDSFAGPVADGLYEVDIQGNAYTVSVDNTLPDAGISLPNVYSFTEMLQGIRTVRARYSTSASATDANMKRATLEQSRDGISWSEIDRSLSQNPAGFLQALIRSEYVLDSFRITAIDQAGNQRQVVVGNEENQLILLDFREIEDEQLQLTELPYHVPPFEQQPSPVLIWTPSSDSVLMTLEAIEVNEFISLNAEFALPGSPALWLPLDGRILTESEKLDVRAIHETRIEATGPYRHYLEIDFAPLRPLDSVLLRVRAETVDGSVISNHVNLKQTPTDLELRNFAADIRPFAGLDDIQKDLVEALLATRLPTDRTVIWARQSLFSSVINSQLFVISDDDPRYLSPTVIQPAASIAIEGDHHAQAFSVLTSPCFSYRFWWSGQLQTLGDLIRPFSLGDQSDPTLQWTQPCVRLDADWGIGLGAMCENTPTQDISILAQISSELPVATLEVRQISNGQQILVANLPNPPLDEPVTLSIETHGLADGLYEFEVSVELSDGSRESQSLLIPIDRQASSVQIDEPQEAGTVCANHTDDGLPWIRLIGEITDDNRLYHQVLISSGDNNFEFTRLFPASLSDDCDPDNAAVPGGCFGSGAVLGQLYPIDPDRSRLILPDSGEATLLVESIDTSGARQCVLRTFQLDADVSVTPELPKSLFSPNGDGRQDELTIQLDIAESVNLRVELFEDGPRIKPSSDPLNDPGWTAIGMPIGVVIPSTDLDTPAQFDWDGQIDGLTVDDGTYMLVITANDDCGLIRQIELRIEVDTTEPEVDISYPKPSDDLGVIVEVTGSFSDLNFKQSLLEYVINDERVLFQVHDIQQRTDAVIGQWNLQGLSSGQYNLELTAEDEAGNQAVHTEVIQLDEITSLIWQFNTTLTAFSPNSDGIVDDLLINLGMLNPANVVLDVLDQNGQLIQTLLSGDVLDVGAHLVMWNGQRSSGQIAVDGLYSLSLMATQVGGGVTQSESITIRLDNSPPSIVRSSPGDQFVRANTDLVVQFDDVSPTSNRVMISIDQGNAVQVFANERLGEFAVFNFDEPLADQYIATVTATDLIGNQSTVSWTFIGDRIAPMVSIQTPVDQGYLASTSQTPIEFTVSEDHLNEYRLELRPSGGAWSLLSSGIEAGDYSLDAVNLPSDGAYELRLSADDLSGQSSVVVKQFIIDTVAPIVEISLPQENQWVGEGALITGTVYDPNLATFTLSYAYPDNPGVWLDFASGLDSIDDDLIWQWLNVPIDGRYVLRLMATDHAGLTSQVMRTVQVDTQDPDAPTALSAQVQSQGDVQLTWALSASQDVLGYRILRDGQPINSTLITTQQVLDSQVADGSHRYQVIAVDQAGNESTGSNVVEVRIDTTAPTTAILQPVDGMRLSRQVDLIGTAHSSNDFLHYRLYLRPSTDPVPGVLLIESATPVAGEILYRLDTNGLTDEVSYTLLLQASDTQQNVSEFEVNFTSDNVSPDQPLNLAVTVLDPDSIELSWQASMAADLAGYVVFADDQLVSGNGVTVVDSLITDLVFTVDDLSDGNHSFYILAVDQAGNLSVPSNVVMHSVENRSPHVDFIEPADGIRFQQPLYIRLGTDDLDVVSVLVEYRTVGGGTWIQLDTLTNSPFETSFDPAAMSLPFGAFDIRATATDASANTDLMPATIVVDYADLIAPDVPQNLTVAVIGGAATLNWSPVTDDELAGYHVYRRLNDGDSVRITTTPITGITFVDSGLPDEQYTYTVTAIDLGENESQPSTMVQVDVFKPVVLQPFTPTLNDRIDLQARSGVVADLFVEISNGTTDSMGPFAQNSDGSFAIPTQPLSPGISMLELYQVKPDGDRSKSVIVFVNRASPPPAPGDLEAMVNGFDVDLSWLAPIGGDPIAGYRIYRDGTLLNALVDSSPVSSQATSSSGNTDLTYDDRDFTYWAPDLSDLVSGTSSIEWNLGPSQQLKVLHLEWQVRFDFDSQTNVTRRPSSYQLSVFDGMTWVPLLIQSNSLSTSDTIVLSSDYRTDQVRLTILAYDESLFQPVRLAEVSFDTGSLQSSQQASETVSDGIYSYQVSAVSVFGFEGPMSEAVNAEVGDVTPPQAVTLSGMVMQSDVTLTWTASPDADVLEYRIFRDGDLIGVQSDLMALQIIDANVPIGQYEYVVAVVDMAGNQGASSNAITLDVDVQLLPAPQNLEVISTLAGDALQLSWDPVAGATQYRVIRSTQSGGPYTDVVITAMTEHADLTVLAGVVYHYQVLAMDAANNPGDPSAEVSGQAIDQIPPQVPVIFSPTQPGQPVVIDTLSVTIAGAAENGAMIELYNNGQFLGETLVHDEFDDQTQLLSNGFSGDALSADGRYLAISGEPDRIVDLITEAEIQLPTASSNAMTWSNSGAALYLLQSGADDTLLRFDLKAMVLETVMVAPSINFAKPTPNEDKVFFTGSAVNPETGSQETGYWLFDRSTVAFSRVGMFDQIGIGRDTVQWSPSGQWLSLTEDRPFPESAALWLFRLGDGSFAQIAEDVNLSAEVTWSSDSNFLAFIIDEGAGDQVAIHNVDTGAVQVISSASSGASQPAISPDGRLLAYLDGCCELVVISMIDGGIQAIFNLNFGRQLIWANDGVLIVDQIGRILRVQVPGFYALPNVTLSVGDNVITAIARDLNGLRSFESESIEVRVEMADLPDLAIAAGGLTVTPALGDVDDQFTIQVQVRNLGLVASSETQLNLVVSHDDDTVVLQTSELLPSMAVGDEQVFEWVLPSLTRSGIYELLATVDPGDVIVELSEINNQQSFRFGVSEPGAPVLALSTLQSVYGFGQQVSGQAELTSTVVELDGRLSLMLTDDDQNTLYEQDVTVEALGFNQTLITSFDWQPPSLFHGGIDVHARFESQQGTILTERIRRIEIDRFADLQLLIDASPAAVSPSDLVTLTANLQYLTGNSLETGQIAWQIRSPSDVLLASFNTALPSILPGFAAEFSESWTAVNEVGDYSIVANLVTESTNLVVETLVTVNAGLPGQTITGVLLDVPPTHIHGTELSVDHRVTNAGNGGFDGTIRLALLESGNGNTIRMTDTVVSLAMGESLDLNAIWPTETLALANHLIVMTALPDDTTQDVLSLDNQSIALVDGEGPIIDLLAPQQDGVYRAELTVQASVEDRLQTIRSVQVSLDGNPPVEMSAPVLDDVYGRLLSGLMEGVHQINITAVDFSGNESVMGPIDFIVDETQPLIEITGVSDQQVTNQTLTPLISITETHLQRSEVLLNNLPFSSGTPISHDGLYTLSVSAEDQVGLIAYTELGFEIDTVAPLLELINPQSGQTVTIPVIEFSGTAEALSIVTLSVNNTDYQVTTSAEGQFLFDSVILNEGINAYQLQAIDRADNPSELLPGEVNVILTPLIFEDGFEESTNRMYGNGFELSTVTGQGLPGDAASTSEEGES